MDNFTLTVERWNDEEIIHGQTMRLESLEVNTSLRDCIQTMRYDRPALREDICSFPSEHGYAFELMELGTCEMVTYTIHFPSNVTQASRRRLCRLLEGI